MFEESNSKKKLIILGIFILIILVLGVIYYLSNKPQEVVVDAPEIEEQQEDNIEIENSNIVEEKQEDATSILKVKILSLIDNTATVQFTVSLGSDDSGKESIILGDTNTIVYDAASEKVVGLNGVKENMEVLFFGTGNYSIGDLKASALVIGGQNNLRFGRLSEIYKENDDIYVGNISDTNDYINISTETVIENGYTGMKINDLRTIKPNSLVFYYVSPEFVQKSDGLYYDVLKIVVVGDDSR